MRTGVAMGRSTTWQDEHVQHWELRDQGDTVVCVGFETRTPGEWRTSGEWYDSLGGRALGNMEYGWSSLVIDLMME